VLKALIRWLWPPEPSRNPPGPSLDLISRAEFQAELAKFEQRTEFELGEWFDKFSALHARTEKRVNRDRKNNGNGVGQVEHPPEKLSALSFRKPWSV
jgi:hypothetical protein